MTSSNPAGNTSPAPRKRTKPPAQRVLLTGFEPFGDDRFTEVPRNPSWLAATALHGEHIAGHELVAAQLPAVFDSSMPLLASLLRAHKPALVICVGQAGGRSAISLERVAINVNDARIADNAGAQPVDTAVVAGGPAAYFSSLPVKAMRRALESGGFPVEVSQTAGTFVCNHVFYGLMHALARQRGAHRTRGGFIHVPYLPEQGSPALPLEDQIAALRLRLPARCKRRPTQRERRSDQLTPVTSHTSRQPGGGSSRIRRQASHIPNSALPIANTAITSMPAVSSLRLCTSQTSAEERPLSANINQKAG